MINHAPLRSLENYIKQHPRAAGCRTLTDARIVAFGRKRSCHGADKAISKMPEGPFKLAARTFWGELGYDV
jgi:hypothetical protein